MNIPKEILTQMTRKFDQELDSNFINGFISELEKCRENKKSIDTKEPKLLFDNFFIMDDFSDFFNIYSNKSKDNTFSSKYLISKSLCLFKCLKYISENSEDNPIRQQILNYLHYTQSYQKNNFLMFLLMFHLHKS